ncbi:TMM53-like protein [Mya arenaria]|uniref:TMM53-like protein n=1 Tax=Mya arenaria TaxID=6604 RepID=A0ABY7DX98_MYAAR|nr:transmembrane protein 53-like [Mya arenaria]WAR02360.1 TMM53-like protein [Mya arenaria]
MPSRTGLTIYLKFPNSLSLTYCNLSTSTRVLTNHGSSNEGQRDRHEPTSVPRHTHRHISNNLSITHHHHDDTSGPRPLILLFGWLFAKPAHLKKYSDFYAEHGFDVLTAKLTLAQLLRPKKVQRVMTHLLDLCHEGPRQEQPLLCHALSVGGYMYGELLTSLARDMEKYPGFDRRLFGKILDSPVDYYGIPKGVARAMTDDRERSQRIENSLHWYLDKFRPITHQYIRASDKFHANEMKTPSLILYSLSDPVCNPDHLERLAKTWRQKGIEAETAFWERAPHVASFKMYPDEYKSQVIDFIWRTGIPGHRMPRIQHSV